MRERKKRVDFSVRPRAEALPPHAEQWVRGEARAVGPRPDGGPQKRLTLNLPAALHTAFKGRCVVEGITIQDKVRVLIERELATGEGASTPAGL
jgi:hypothetical protein